MTDIYIFFIFFFRNFDFDRFLLSFGFTFGCTKFSSFSQVMFKVDFYFIGGNFIFVTGMGNFIALGGKTWSDECVSVLQLISLAVFTLVSLKSGVRESFQHRS